MAVLRSRILFWSALSGALWLLAWPAIGGLAPMAFVAWLPLLHAERLHDKGPGGIRRHFVPSVLVALFIWNAGASWWFFMVSEPLSTKVASVTAPIVVNTLLMAVPWWLKRIVHRQLGGRVASYAFILFWLGFEHLHHDWDMQWPWFSIGNVFGVLPSWVQWYDHTGMLGGSLWVLLVALLLDRSISSWQGRASSPWWVRPHLWTGIVLLLPIGASLLRWYGHVEEGVAVEVVVVQPNVDPYLEKFGGVDPLAQLERMLDLAEAAATPATRLVVMPETSLQEHSTVDRGADGLVLQGLWENDLGNSKSVHRLRAFRQQYPDIALLAGMSSYYLHPPEVVPPATARPLGDGLRHYDAANAALFLPVEGPIQYYRKSKLVAGVELMPFERHLGPLGHLAIDLGGTTGSLAKQLERSVLTDEANELRIVPAICYESVFGEHIAAHVRNGGNLIAIMTNDGWWGRSPGYRQHLAFAPLRAIETRRAIARSANTGTSCFVDQRGGIREATAWWVPDARVATVHLNDRITFFVMHGDQIGRTALLFAILLLVHALVHTLRRSNAAARRG